MNLYTLLSTRVLFEEFSLSELTTRICNARYRMPEFPDPYLPDLISKSSTVDPKTDWELNG